MSDMEEPLVMRRCPRCGEAYNESQPATSRATDAHDDPIGIEICGACGSDEAVGRGVRLVAQWPLGPNPPLDESKWEPVTEI